MGEYDEVAKLFGVSDALFRLAWEQAIEQPGRQPLGDTLSHDGDITGSQSPHGGLDGPVTPLQQRCTYLYPQ